MARCCLIPLACGRYFSGWQEPRSRESKYAEPAPDASPPRGGSPLHSPYDTAMPSADAAAEFFAARPAGPHAGPSDSDSDSDSSEGEVHASPSPRSPAARPGSAEGRGQWKLPAPPDPAKQRPTSATNRGYCMFCNEKRDAGACASCGETSMAMLLLW